MTVSTNEKLLNAFSKGLAIDRGKVSDKLAYNSIPEWDSVAHMALVAELELVFDIMLDTDDIIDMSSVGKTKEILAKYDVKF